MSIYEEYEKHNCTIRIENDDQPENPFENWDMLGHLLTWHRNYTFSNDKMADWGMFESSGRLYAEIERYGKDGVYEETEEVLLAGYDDIAAYLEKQYGAVVLPVFLFDHSGLSMKTSSASFRAADSYGWDWGLVGVTFATRDEILKEQVAYTRKGKERPRYENGKTIYPEWVAKARITKKDRALAEEALQTQIKVMDQYLTGDVWGYVVTHNVSGEEDSLWGMYGLGYCREEAEMTAKNLDDAYDFDVAQTLDAYVASIAAD